MYNLNFFYNIDLISVIEMFFIILVTVYCSFKIIDIVKIKVYYVIIDIISTFIISITTIKIKSNIDSYHSLLVLIFLTSFINIINFKNGIIYSVITTIISLAISYCIYICSVSIAFFPNYILNIKNEYISVCIIIIIYMLLVFKIFRIKKFKHGIIFLRNKAKDSHYGILIIQLCIIILFLKTYIYNTNRGESKRIWITLIIFSASMIISIKEFIQLYYKQTLLVKDLEHTKSELEEKKKEIDKLEKENLEFSKTSHSLAHKQKSLEYKLEKLMKTNVDSKDKESMKKEIQSISKEVYKEPQQIELPKTEVELIDDMFSYMQAECIDNKIKFELQVVGNIFYMINHLISENDLEILIADHIKDAIIAINHYDNSNRSILVRIGKINNVYSLYIFDSGAEFEKAVLENLGKKPITTHADTGGTGMGFMNTFETLNRTKASLIINEIGKPCIDNYTKVLIFKFDSNNEFKVESYRNEVIII